MLLTTTVRYQNCCVADWSANFLVMAKMSLRSGGEKVRLGDSPNGPAAISLSCPWDTAFKMETLVRPYSVVIPTEYIDFHMTILGP